MSVATASSDPISQRFAQLIQQFGLTKNAFAMSLGKTATVVQHLIEGRNKPGYDLLCRVFEVYPNVSRDWLLLGRGPMLVSGEAAPRLVPARPAAPAPELPLTPPAADDNDEPIDLPPPRRPTPGVAGTRLQPADIAATLALAAATARPARSSAPTDAPALSAAELFSMFAPPEPSIPPVPPAVPVAAPPATPVPDAGVAALLHTQYLQHQLALAELRNQHLLEQQKLLREMLDMARR